LRAIDAVNEIADAQVSETSLAARCSNRSVGGGANALDALSAGRAANAVAYRSVGGHAALTGHETLTAVSTDARGCDGAGVGAARTDRVGLGRKAGCEIPADAD
jgi:hypothetical protein